MESQLIFYMGTSIAFLYIIILILISYYLNKHYQSKVEELPTLFSSFTKQFSNFFDMNLRKVFFKTFNSFFWKIIFTKKYNFDKKVTSMIYFTRILLLFGLIMLFYNIFSNL